MRWRRITSNDDTNPKSEYRNPKQIRNPNSQNEYRSCRHVFRLVPSFPNSVWERTTAKLCFADARETRRAGAEAVGGAEMLPGPPKRSFGDRRSQTEFGNEETHPQI